MPYYRFDEMIQPDYQKYNSIYKVPHFIKTFNKKTKNHYYKPYAYYRNILIDTSRS